MNNSDTKVENQSEAAMCVSSQLTPVSYRIEQNVNEHVYHIDRHMTERGPKWLIRYGPPYNPVYVVGAGRFAYYHEGFDTPEEALRAWQQWYPQRRQSNETGK